MKGKAELLAAIAKGDVKETTVEVVEMAKPISGSRRKEIVPDDGKIASAYPDLVPLDVTVRWRHPAEKPNDVQSGSVWKDKDGVPVVVHGGCFGIFPLADVVVLDEENREQE
jgi:hypothetical protein